MRKTMIALAAALLSSAAGANTLIDNVNGIQAGTDGTIERFTGLLIGDDGKVLRLVHAGDEARISVQVRIDGHGETLLPGLIDAHGHVTDLGFAALHLNLVGTSSLGDLKQRLSAYAAAHPNAHWIIGFGWNQELWPDKRFPTSADLDAVIPDRPVVLERVDGHGVVANTAAMKAAGVTAQTPAPSGGRIDNGFFVDAARRLIDKAVPAPTTAELDQALAKAQEIKFFADGALGSRGAWLKQPYADKPDSRGLQFHSDAEILSLADQAATAGFQIATHAIGDAANAQMISTYEQLHRKYPGDRRWRIEHFQIVDPIDIPRLARTGIVASMQPTHQTSDRLMAEKRLGTNRLAGAYAWQTVLKSGAKLAFGTDFPVESPNPFPGLSAAISRQDINGLPPGGWIPSERLALGQALHAYSRGSAYAGFAEGKIGALDPGKWADFILVDRDPGKVDAQSLARTEVLETWIAGMKVWSRATGGSPLERGK